MKDLEKFLPALDKADKVLEQIREIEQNPPAWEDADFPSPLNVDTAEILLRNTVDEITEAQDKMVESFRVMNDEQSRLAEERVIKQEKRESRRFWISFIVMLLTLIAATAAVVIPLLQAQTPR